MGVPIRRIVVYKGYPYFGKYANFTTSLLHRISLVRVLVLWLLSCPEKTWSPQGKEEVQ